MSKLAGKSVLITGASRGIGEAAAREFAAQGAFVVLAARSETRIGEITADIEAAGGRAIAIPCDVAEYASVRQAVFTAVEPFGRIDILINNAGIIDPVGHLADIDPEDWTRVIDINVKGVFHGLHATIPIMEQQGGGTIINISSGAATSPMEGWSHYCSSKAAVLMITRNADKEYGRKGITILGYSPGTVATEMQVQIKASGINPVSKLELSDHYPPELPAQALAYLASGAGKRWAGKDCSHKDDEFRAEMGWN